MHGYFRGRVLCLATGLLADKTIGTYRQMFQTLKNEIRRLTGNRWAPAICISDFEQSIVTAFETEFPNARVNGCYFHFAQNLWRKIQELGLAAAYRHNINLKRCLQKVMALGFVPLPVVRITYQNFLLRASTLRLINIYPNLQLFFNYFSNNYMNGNFQPLMWNVYQRRMEFRTNNFVESYHSRWNNAVGVRHPSLWYFIRVLKDQEAVNQVAVQGMLNGNPPPARKRKWRELERQIDALKNQYNVGVRNLDSYWRAVCHRIVQFR